MTSRRNRLIRDKKQKGNASNLRSSRDSRRKRERREERKLKLSSHLQVPSKEESLARLSRARCLMTKRRKKSRNSKRRGLRL